MMKSARAYGELQQLAGVPWGLLDRLGFPMVPSSSLARPAGNGAVCGAGAELAGLLRGYRERVLVKIEWPVIAASHGYASRSEIRSLLELDEGLSRRPGFSEWRARSCAEGRAQLDALRRLRDERVVQRFRAAVEAGEAMGWHLTVYGVVLAVYSLPLRQGLMSYACRTMKSLAESSVGEGDEDRGGSEAGLVVRGAMDGLEAEMCRVLEQTIGVV